MLGDALSLAGQFGPMGLLVAYIIWDKQRTDTKWRDHEAARLKQDAARVEADKAMAQAMTALSIVIQGRPHV